MGDLSFAVMREMGAAIGHMHGSDVVHGDLTTSNIMIRRTGDGQEGCQDSWSDLDRGGFQIVLIDFGLGMTQPSVEDRAVDLYVLERAFLSTHPGSDGLVSAFGCLLECWVCFNFYFSEQILFILFCAVLCWLR